MNGWGIYGEGPAQAHLQAVWFPCECLLMLCSPAALSLCSIGYTCKPKASARWLNLLLIYSHLLF